MSAKTELNKRRKKNLKAILDKVPGDQLIIHDAFTKADSVINNPKYKKVLCSVSGGSDSDIMFDICSRIDIDKKVEYLFYDTGIEWQATKEHLDKVEKKYGIKIKRRKPSTPVPLAVKKTGQPFISKKISDCIMRLQRYGFKWEDRPFDELYAEYPTCKSALRWWCNEFGEGSRFNIQKNKWLKEFMVQNPPQFKISNKCCDYAKKNVAHEAIREEGYDLNLVGVRKGEGGARSTVYKGCFTENEDGCDMYRPIWWFDNADKESYCSIFGVEHSNCYSMYRLRRTGCAACPFGLKFEEELAALEKYEPRLHKAVCNIFKDSYEYTRAYRAFRDRLGNDEHVDEEIVDEVAEEVTEAPAEPANEEIEETGCSSTPDKASEDEGSIQDKLHNLVDEMLSGEGHRASENIDATKGFYLMMTKAMKYDKILEALESKKCTLKQLRAIVDGES